MWLVRFFKLFWMDLEEMGSNLKMFQWQTFIETTLMQQPSEFCIAVFYSCNYMFMCKLHKHSERPFDMVAASLPVEVFPDMSNREVCMLQTQNKREGL